MVRSPWRPPTPPSRTSPILSPVGRGDKGRHLRNLWLWRNPSFLMGEDRGGGEASGHGPSPPVAGPGACFSRHSAQQCGSRAPDGCSSGDRADRSLLRPILFLIRCCMGWAKDAGNLHGRLTINDGQDFIAGLELRNAAGDVNLLLPENSGDYRIRGQW
jgi:hypothetical protein